MMNSKDDTGTESEVCKKPTPTSTNPQRQISIQIIPKTNNSETTPPKENKLLNQRSHRNTIQQPNHQKSHTQSPKTQTNSISKLREDGGFKG